MRDDSRTIMRRASALLMSALLAFSAFPTEAFAQVQEKIGSKSDVLGDEALGVTSDDGVVAHDSEFDDLGTDSLLAEPDAEEVAESSILGESVADDAQQVLDEEDLSADEDPLVEEPVNDSSLAAEDDQVVSVADSNETVESAEGEADEVLDAGRDLATDENDGALFAQTSSDGKDYYFDKSDGKSDSTAQVRVYGVTSGTVSYDQKTNTLRLNSATVAGYIESDHNLTIELIGNNTVKGWNVIYYDSITVKGGLTIAGSGSIELYESASCTTLTMRGGSIDSEVSASGSVTMSGGTITGSISGGGNVVMSGGTVKGKVSCRNLTMDGKGSIVAEDDYSSGLSCTTLTMRGGSIASEVSASGSVTMSGGTIRGGVYCSTLTMSNKASIVYKTTSSNSFRSAVSCTTLTMSNKASIVYKIIDKDSHYYQSGVSCTTLTMRGGSITARVSARGSVTMSGGTVKGGISCRKLVLSKKAFVSGGIEANANSGKGGNVTMSGGTVKGGISCRKLVLSKKAFVSGRISGGVVSMSGATVRGTVSCEKLTMTKKDSIIYEGKGHNDGSTGISCGSIEMKGGSIKISKCNRGMECKGLVMTGGSILIKDCDYGIEAEEYANAKTASIIVKKGSIAVINPSYCGISANHGDLIVSGGKVAVSGSYGTAISITDTVYRGKRYGGKVKLTGGKLTATVRDVASNAAIRAYSMSNKPGCLKKIIGRLPTGARFKSGGNTYQVNSYGNATIFRYGSKKTEASFNKVKYGKMTYLVSGAAAKAFNTKRGAALTKITFVNSLSSIGAYAFKGTTSLRSLVLKGGLSGVYASYASESTYTLYYSDSYKSKSFSKNAFKGIGANGGYDLTVSISGGEAFRNFFTKKGLSVGVRLEHYSY